MKGGNVATSGSGITVFNFLACDTPATRDSIESFGKKKKRKLTLPHFDIVTYS